MMNSFREITRALHLKERFEAIAAELPSTYPYKYLNFYSAGIVSDYMVGGINTTKQYELAAIATEFRQIYNSVERSRDKAFEMGE